MREMNKNTSKVFMSSKMRQFSKIGNDKYLLGCHWNVITKTIFGLGGTIFISFPYKEAEAKKVK